MDTKEIREMSEKDLREKLDTSRAALNQMLLNHAVSPLENTSQIRKAKKDIPRMLTILTEIDNKKQSK